QRMVRDEFVEAVEEAMDQQLSDDPARGFVGVKGLDAMMNREFDKAIAAYSEEIERDPKAAHAYLDRGDVYLFKGDHERALADYEEAVRLEPNNQAALSRRDALRADTGKGNGRLKVIEGRSLKKGSGTVP